MGKACPDMDFLDSYKCQQKGSQAGPAWASPGVELDCGPSQASHGGGEEAEGLANPHPTLTAPG